MPQNLVNDLRESGNLVKIEDYTHNVGTCYRCHTTIESIVSKQWFVSMKPLAQPAIEAVRSGEIQFIPDRFAKSYFNWMEISGTGAFPGSFGGGIGFLCGIVMPAAKCSAKKLRRKSAPAAAVIFIRMKMYWIHGSPALYGHSLRWAGRIIPKSLNTSIPPAHW